MRRTDHPSRFRAGIISRALASIEAVGPSAMLGELALFRSAGGAICGAPCLDALTPR